MLPLYEIFSFTIISYFEKYIEPVKIYNRHLGKNILHAMMDENCIIKV